MMHEIPYRRFPRCSPVFVLGLVVVALASTAFGQYAIVQHTIDGGGATPSAGGTYAVSGTIGQHDAGVLAGGSYVLTGGFWQAATTTVPEPLESTGEAARTNRYLRFVVPAGASSNEVIRVRFVSLDGFPVPAPDVLYVGPPTDAPDENSGQPGLTFRVAPLVCSPYTQDWSGEGTVSVYGAEIMPGSTYEVQRAASTCPHLATDETCWSTALTITTATFGDTVEPFEGSGPVQPDFSDIASLVSKFLGEPTAPIKAVAQLQPNVAYPSRPIDFKDIAADVLAFLGTPYPSAIGAYGPCTCPSTVTCGVTPCSGDAACQGVVPGGGDGLCIDGFCTDQCGRCGP